MLQAQLAERVRIRRLTKTGTQDTYWARLQVKGCQAELRRSHQKRVEVCEFHMVVTCVRQGDSQTRFCMQCERFHALDNFDGDLRCAANAASRAKRDASFDGPRLRLFRNTCPCISSRVRAYRTGESVSATIKTIARCALARDVVSAIAGVARRRCKAALRRPALAAACQRPCNAG